MSRSLNLVLAAFAALAGCAAPPPQATGWNPPAEGSSWEIAQRNTGSFGRDVQFRVSRANGEWKGRPAVLLKNSLGPTIVADPVTGQWMAVLGANGQPAVTYDPPIGWQYPLQVGKSFTSRHRVTTHTTGRTDEFDFACKVEAYEPVTVRAGTFDAFRIHCSAGAADETYWTAPAKGVFVKTRLLRSAADPRGAGTQEAELLAAPAVR